MNGGESSLLSSTLQPPPLNNTMFFQLASIYAESSSESKIVQIPAEAPSGIYQVQFQTLYNLNPIQIRAYNQGKDLTWDTVLSVLYESNRPILNENGGMITTSGWAYDTSTDSVTFTASGGVDIWRLDAFFNHTTGSPSNAFRFESGTEGWSPNSFLSAVILRQIA